MTTKEVPTSRKLTSEVITPHRLTVAILIHNFCQYRDSDNFKILQNNFLSCKYRRDFCILVLKLIQSPDLSLEELRNILQSSQFCIPKEVIESFDELLNSIYVNGSGHLLDSIDGVNRILLSSNENSVLDISSTTKTSIIKNSVIGYYLRRLIVNFEKLTFSEVTGVYLAFQRYYDKWKNSKKDVMNVRRDILNNDWSADENQWSRRQAELFIATQAALLANNEEKALGPVELQNRIASLLQSNPDISEAHFLSYLNYVRVKEFCGAIDSLYHCFDKSAIFDNKSTAEEKNRAYRYAALNLAILHYQFGHHEKSLASLREAIKISQEANDNVCLQHALSWLYRLTNIDKEKLIKHCIFNRFELNLSYTKSLGLQNYGKLYCQNAGKPLLVFEILNQSDVFNSQNGHKDLIANNYSMRSAIWQYYGKSEVSSLWSQLFLYINIDSKTANNSFYDEAFCLAVCNIANQLLMEGEYNLVYTILNFAKQRFPHEPQSLMWMLSENIFVFIRSIHHEDWNEAEAAARKIMVLDKLEGYLKLAELYYLKEDYIEANRCINIFFENFDKNNTNMFQNYYVRAKILVAEIQFSSGFPDLIPAGIISNLNECLLDTRDYNLDYYTALIDLHVANIQLQLGLTTQALKVLDRCMVQILAHGGNFDRARTTLLFVKCLIADSSKLETEERKDVILNSAQLLNKVKTDFEQVEAYSRVKDVLYLQAQLYNNLNMNAERNKCAYQYRMLEEEYVTKNSSTLIKFL